MVVKLLFAVVLGGLNAAWAGSNVVSAGESHNHSLEQIFLELEPLSGLTRRREIRTLEAPLDLSVFTRLRRQKSNGNQAYSNATLIAGGDCYWIASAAGHSVLDQRYSRLANRDDVEVMLPDGSWANPVEMTGSAGLGWDSEEVDDWALLVLLSPRCAFDDSRQFAEPLPHIQSGPLSFDNLQNCTSKVQMLCYHFDQRQADGLRMLERDCQMRHRRDESDNGSTGYISCKVDYGVSGCSPVCVQDGIWLNLGVFSKGLQRHRADADQQRQAGAIEDG